jgi:hypothetical protein
MEQLETIKSKSIVIPKLVTRFMILSYDINFGWRGECELFTNPESAIQNFMSRQSQYKNDNIKYYKVVELEVEIPFVPKT